MEIRYLEKQIFLQDYFPLIVELLCGKHYDASNKQHAEWVPRRVDAFYSMGGKAICLHSDEDRPIGLLFLLYDPGLENVCSFGKNATIAMFGFFPEYRSKGFGSKLLRVAETFLSESGCECLYVDTYANNRDAIRYYTKEGFIPVAYHPGLNGLDDKGQVFLYKELMAR